MKKIVVFFPSWRYFGHFAVPLFEPLAKRFDIVFFHTEQAVYGWNDCPDLSEKNIQTVDLKSLKTFSFVKALERLKPDCVVVFDKGWMQDRALLHATKHLNIPSLHVQHGSVAMLDDVQTHNRLRRMLNEFAKIMQTFRLYNASISKLGFRAWVKSLPFQMQLLTNPNNYYYNHRKEVKCDRVCIIGDSERTFFLEKEGYDESQLVPLGNLQYEDAYALRENIDDEDSSENRILLLSQPLFEDHYMPGGNDAKKAWMDSIIRTISGLPGATLAVKPHPRESNEWYRENFTKEELYVYPQGSDLNEAILESRHVIGFFSTALVNALILKRPVGIIRWIGDHGFAPNFDEDGAAMALREAEDLIKFVLQYECAFDVSWYAYNRNVSEVLETTINTLVEGSCWKRS